MVDREVENGWMWGWIEFKCKFSSILMYSFGHDMIIVMQQSVQLLGFDISQEYTVWHVIPAKYIWWMT